MAIVFEFLGGLRFLLIDPRELVACVRLRFEKLIELCVNGLRVAMLAPLDEQRHAPGRKRCDAMPVK